MDSIKLVDVSWKKQKNRRGLLVQIRSKTGKQAIGEIAPLKGFSRETVEQTEEELESFRQYLLCTDWSIDTIENCDTWPCSASVRFGLCSSLLDLLDPIDPSQTVKSYAHLAGTKEEILTRSQEEKKRGKRSAKVKLGPLDVAEGLEIWERLHQDFTLRFDCNRLWSMEKSRSFFSQLPENSFLYVEEPASDPIELVDFPYPFALDETTREKSDLSPWLSLNQCKALIIKPTLIYPIKKFLSLNIRLILTSSYESAVGIAHIEKLVRRHQLTEQEHGLDTL